MNVLITGGSGFIGQALCHRLLVAGHQLTVLSRQPEKISSLFNQKVVGVSSLAELSDDIIIDAIVNLAGTPIADARWTDKRKRLLKDSRIDTTESLLDFIDHAKVKPKLLISGSAIGYYGDQGDKILDERSGTKHDFAQQLCTIWEQTASKATDRGLRVCLLRIGLVIGPKIGSGKNNKTGFLQRMLLPFKLGLGGRIGHGKQWMSWIHRDDLVAMIELLLNSAQLSGVFNGTAPNPVTNQTFTESLAKVLRRPAMLPIPAFALKLIMGEMASLLLGGQRVIPKRFLAEGYQFRFENLQPALEDVIKPRKIKPRGNKR